ncbi:MAG: hypothetical protein HDS59_07495 [Barnesiella sp.]|nr:hypothetical protein [Barnesiella sp.]
MNILDSASSTEKELVRRIVDNYRGGYENIKADKHSILDSPGCWLHSLFYDFNLSASSCFINFSNKDNQLLATYVLPKGDDASDFFQQINIKKASFFEQIAFLKLLFQNNLIFFDQDYDCGLSKFSGHSDHDVENWESHGLGYYDEIIKNNSIFDFLNTYYWSYVIPSSILCDYKDNDFKTVEAKRHRENAILSRIGIISAFIIALISPWLMTRYSKTSIEPVQLDTILNAIPKQVDQIKLNEEQVDSILTNIDKIIKSHNGKAENEKR